MSDWRDMSELKPPENPHEQVLAWDALGFAELLYWSTAFEEWRTEDDGGHVILTGWRPITPPNGEWQ